MPAHPRPQRPSSTITREQYYGQPEVSDDYFGPESVNYNPTYDEAYDQGYQYESYQQDAYEEAMDEDPSYEYASAPPDLVFGSAPPPSVTEMGYSSQQAVASRGRQPTRRVARGGRRARVTSTQSRAPPSTPIQHDRQPMYTAQSRPVHHTTPPNRGNPAHPPRSYHPQQASSRVQQPPSSQSRRVTYVPDDSFEDDPNDNWDDENGYENQVQSTQQAEQAQQAQRAPPQRNRPAARVIGQQQQHDRHQEQSSRRVTRSVQQSQRQQLTPPANSSQEQLFDEDEGFSPELELNIDALFTEISESIIEEKIQDEAQNNTDDLQLTDEEILTIPFKDLPEKYYEQRRLLQKRARQRSYLARQVQRFGIE